MQAYLPKQSTNGAVGRKTTRHNGQRGRGENLPQARPTARSSNDLAGKPPLLMLSHCVPDPMGNADRARAWQMLRLARQTHQVHLACIMDESVHLDQWRLVDSLACTTVIQNTPAHRKIYRRIMEPWNQSQADQRCMPHTLRRSVRAMRKDHSYDAVLCTHPGLWPLAERVRANVRVCDLYMPRSILHRQLLAQEGSNPAMRSWHAHRLRQCLKHEQYIAHRADILCLGTQEATHLFSDQPCHSLVVTDAVDLGYFKLPACTQPLPAPQVVLHDDWHSSLARQAGSWFTQNIWPQIKRAVPQAVLTCSGPAQSKATMRRLGFASVIISSLTQRSQDIWPTLQAMAMARPVIAPRESIENLEVRHGEHLLIPHRTQDWVDLCVQSLRNAAMRLQLAQGARNFIQQHCPIEQTGAALRFALARHVNQIPVLAQAA